MSTALTILPKDLQFSLLLDLSDQDLFHMCLVNKSFASICKDEYFWKLRGQKRYRDEFIQLQREANDTFKTTYRLARDLTHLLTVFQLKETILSLFKTNYFNLDLSHRDVTILPKEIRVLRNLESLDVARNKLTTLPKEIGLLTNLGKLFAFDNLLESLPKEIGLLGNLTILSLHNNRLTTLPKEIGSLQKLEDLYLSQNELENLPKEIGLLKNLRRLDLRNNQLKTLPMEIASLGKLYLIYLSTNLFTNVEKEKIKNILRENDIGFNI